ncbi:MAG: cyclic nucleotide-binding domain-containing protein [Anaerolineae bacterium]|nr:cyclic nucleotide-binding domain-containing protein [Anaerolineae bacterium]
MSVDRKDILEVLKMVYPFHRKEERYLQEIISYCNVIECHAGEIIYKEGEECGALYMVQSGQIELQRGFDSGSKPAVRLSSGDFFGFELFEKDGRYRATAVAMRDSAVLVFRKDVLVELASKFLWFQRGLLTMFDSYQQARRVRLDWMGVDEVIYFISRRHNAFLFFNLIFPLTAAIACFLMLAFVMLLGINPLVLGSVFGGGLLLALLACGWVYLDWTNDYSIVTNQRVVFQEKVVLLYDSRQEAPMNAVLKVDTATSLLGRWLGYGNVIASTYAGLVILRSLNRPEEAAAIVLAESERAFLRRRQVEKKELDSLIRNRLNVQPLQGNGPKLEEITHQVKPGKLQVMLANMFRMRFEEGPKITYRTHWFILFLKLCLPTIVLIGVFIAFMLRISNILQVLPVTVFAALAMILAVIAFLGWIYEYADWRNDYYVVTPDQVVDVYKKPLGREERQAAPLKNIQSIEFKRKGILGLLLNFGTVFIRVGDAELTFDNVFNPAEIQRDLFHRIAERDYREKQEALAEEKTRLGDWIEAYHHIQQEGKTGQNPSSTESVSG